MGNKLGQFEEFVLLALVLLRANAYGAAIRREIAERTGRDISVGAVYSTLERLQRKGYVSSWWGEATPKRGGRAKRYFKIEEPGAEALSEVTTAAARLGRSGGVKRTKASLSRHHATEFPVTPQMIEAGMRAFICDCGAEVHRDKVVLIYRAMRAAAPDAKAEVDGDWAE